MRGLHPKSGNGQVPFPDFLLDNFSEIFLIADPKSSLLDN
jgi:hypothetical protein